MEGREMNGPQEARMVIPEESFHLSEGWPGTPPVSRMKRAQELMESMSGGEWSAENVDCMNDQEQQDLYHLVRACQAAGYGDHCVREMTKRVPPENDQEVLDIMIGYARAADTQETIGLIYSVQEGDKGAQTGQMGVGKIPRHPEWMGTVPFWPISNGMNATIVESEYDERPGVLMMNTPETDQGEFQGRRTPPDDETGKLVEILKWHGVKDYRCLKWKEIQRANK